MTLRNCWSFDFIDIYIHIEIPKLGCEKDESNKPVVKKKAVFPLMFKPRADSCSLYIVLMSYKYTHASL